MTDPAPLRKRQDVAEVMRVHGVSETEALAAMDAGGVCRPVPWPRRAPSAAEVTRMVDEVAQAEMRRVGYAPEAWGAMSRARQDDFRLLALDRLRRLAEARS